jgi:hypothetical protein
MTSFQPKDVEYRFCGNCHDFHEQLARKVSGGDTRSTNSG